MIPAYLINVDFNKNQLLNPVFQVLGSEPSSPSTGQFFYSSANNKFGYYNGTQWIYGDQLSFANGGAISWNRVGDVVTLTIANATTSVPGFMSAADKTMLTAATAANTANTLVLRDGAGSVAINNLTATSGTVGTNATNSTDIVNLQTLLNYLNTGTKYKEPVRVATNTNVATLSGLIAIDGVTVAANDRVLLYGQTTATQNGIYVASASAWTRSADLPAAANASGVHVIVTEGTANADNIFICTSDNAAATVGTHPLAFNRLPNSIQVDNVTIELAAGVLRIKDGGVTTAKIADGNVTTVKIADANVTTAKIADANVTAAKLASGVADQATITGGAGTALSVANYTAISGTTVQRVRTLTGITIGSSTTITVTHNLNTTNIASVTVKDSATSQIYTVDWVPTSANAIGVTANGANKTVIVTITA